MDITFFFNGTWYILSTLYTNKPNFLNYFEFLTYLDNGSKIKIDIITQWVKVFILIIEFFE